MSLGYHKKCIVCDRIFSFHPMYVGDQSMCTECRSEARKLVDKPSTPEQDEKRRKHFYGD